MYEAARSMGDFVFTKRLHMHKHTHPYDALMTKHIKCSINGDW